MGILRTGLSRAGPPVALLAVVVGIWEAWVRLAGIDPAVLAPPSRVARALVNTSGALAHHAATTLAETAIGLVIGALVGVAVAALVSASSIIVSTVPSWWAWGV